MSENSLNNDMQMAIHVFRLESCLHVRMESQLFDLTDPVSVNAVLRARKMPYI